MKEAFELLNKYKRFLTKQQYRTLKGQILHDDIDGFKKGLTKLINKRCI